MKFLKTSLLFFSSLLILTLYQSQNNQFICNPNFEEIFEEYDYNDINKEWLKDGASYYKELINICINKPDSIESLITLKDRESIDLGYDVSIKKGAFGKGYIGVFYTFIYKNDKLFSYELNMKQKNIFLLENYDFNPQKAFKKIDKGENQIPDYTFYHNYKETTLPLGSPIVSENLTENLKSFMSPYSGITYGCRGGYGNGMLENRCAFKKLIYKQDLLAKDIIYIMHSINLSSRMTVLEYYTRNKNNYAIEEQSEVEKIASNLFIDYGDQKIEILQFDMGFRGSLKEAINLQLESNCY